MSRPPAALLLALALVAGPAAAQQAGPPAKPAGATDTGAASDPDTWIFSGVLHESSESFSGTLITGKSDTQFELKLGDGTTCEGGDLHPSLGLVKLSEIRCSDGRSLRALFVPQAPQSLKVFGHVGGARFAVVAHLLGQEPPPDRGPSLAPRAPLPPAAPQQPR